MGDALVTTVYGPVRGVSDGAMCVWKGIPYAQPPVGPLRFLPPQPPQAWSDERDATSFGPIAPQNAGQMTRMEGAVLEVTSEDCLYLNVWSPSADDKKRPVMVWIHGGAFSLGSGSSPDYDGAKFAAHGDVVVVTLNYRLGALGFLYLGDLSEDYASSANCGLLDQVAALQWVRDNIAEFGGDPENVTIFGESAGAMSIGLLLALPAARGLFQRAILESGAASTVTSIPKAVALREQLLQGLGLQTNDLEALIQTPVDSILAVQVELMRRYGLMTFHPVIDGKVLPERPLDAIAHGAAEQIPLLIGTNRDEMKLFMVMGLNNANPDEATLQSVLGPAAADILAEYSATFDLTPQDAWVALLTDKTFRRPAIQLADCMVERGAPVWMYRFDWATPVFDGALGSAHGLEIPFVWDHIGEGGMGKFLIGENTPEVQRLADQMHAVWIAFARNGHPGTADLPAWPEYDLVQRTTMIFNEACRIVADPQEAERHFWERMF